MYAPSLGAFTSLDSVMGSAANPLSMNRFLYAESNPTTFIDPTGHATLYCNTETSDTCHATQQKTAKKMASTIHRQARDQEKYRWTTSQRARARARNSDLRVVHLKGWAAIRELRSRGPLGSNLISHETPLWEEEKDLLQEIARFTAANPDDADIAASATSAAPIGVFLKANDEGVPGLGPFAMLALGMKANFGKDVPGASGSRGSQTAGPNPPVAQPGSRPANANACNCPNPGGRLGGPDHRAVVSQVEDDILARGLKPRTEFEVRTPGGTKPRRYADVAAFDPADTDFANPLEIHQVGVQTKGGLPVARERRALDEMMTSPDLSNSTTFTFWPYR
jgi:hypothetical protein